MDFNDLLALFERTADIKEWGEDAYIMIFSDGSGEVCDGDDDYLFEFNTPEELIQRLED